MSPRRFYFLCFAVFLVTACGPPYRSSLTVEDPDRNRSIPYKVWQPETTPGTKYPLILLSHGSGGDSGNHQWLVDALVENGYIVAAPNHPGNTTRDNTDAGVISVWDRPRDLSRVLDSLLAEPDYAAVIDASRIGAAGFSTGGYGVIALAGALYDRELIARYCRRDDRGPDCELAEDDGSVDYTDASLSYRDERIRAVFAMAPAVGSGITRDSLRRVTIPVHIVAAQDDELVYPALNAQLYADYIPTATLELLPAGGHFIFLECQWVTHIADWFIEELDLCGRNFSVNRPRIRGQVASKAVNFFTIQLGDGLP